MKYTFTALAALGVLSQRYVEASELQLQTRQYSQSWINNATRHWNKLIELYEDSVKEDEIDAEQILSNKRIVSYDMVRACTYLWRTLDACFGMLAARSSGFTAYADFQYEMYRKTVLKLVLKWLDELSVGEGLERVIELANALRENRTLLPIFNAIEREYGTTDGQFTLHVPYTVLCSSENGPGVDFIGGLAFENVLEYFEEGSMTRKNVSEWLLHNKISIETLKKSVLNGAFKQQPLTPLKKMFQKLGVHLEGEDYATNFADVKIAAQPESEDKRTKIISKDRTIYKKYEKNIQKPPHYVKTSQIQTSKDYKSLMTKCYSKLIKLYKDSVREDEINAEEILSNTRIVSNEILEESVLLLSVLHYQVFDKNLRENDDVVVAYDNVQYEMYRKTVLKLLLKWLNELTEEESLTRIKELTSTLQQDKTPLPILNAIKQEYKTTDGQFTLHTPYTILTTLNGERVVDFIGIINNKGLLDYFEEGSAVRNGINDILSKQKKSIKILEDRLHSGDIFRHTSFLIDIFKKLGIYLEDEAFPIVVGNDLKNTKIIVLPDDKDEQPRIIEEDISLSIWDLGVLVWEIVTSPDKGYIKDGTIYIKDKNLLKKYWEPLKAKQ